MEKSNVITNKIDRHETAIDQLEENLRKLTLRIYEIENPSKYDLIDIIDNDYQVIEKSLGWFTYRSEDNHNDYIEFHGWRYTTIN
ncbi:hypothetical protein KAU11_07500, partial [Candidatus Babeliales bacterium]|nr:hypothetical protein [Candidatus Babeliales bacterium]